MSEKKTDLFRKNSEMKNGGKIGGRDQKQTIYSFGETEPSMVFEASEKYVLSRRLSQKRKAIDAESNTESEEEAKIPLVPRLVSEVLAEYEAEKQQGEYTLEDYLALPDDQRVELIDGVFFEMEAPTYIHQGVGGKLHTVFENYIESRQGSCYVFEAPVDVQLDCDDKTVVEPDVLIVCDLDKFRDGRIYGAPDLVVEVLSPSTSKKDRGLKLAKYRRAGVREYWIIDPRWQRVWVYEFEKSDAPSIYTFEDTVPVGIYGGGCKVDFARIYDRMRALYETM